MSSAVDYQTNWKKNCVHVKMSIIGQNEKLTVISHDAFIKDVYRNVNFDGKEFTFSYKKSYFDITAPFKQRAGKKSKHKIFEKLDNDAVNVLKIHEENKEFISNCLSKNETEMTTEDENQEAVVMADAEFQGGNTTDNSLVASITNNNFLIPPRCRFYNFDVKSISNYLSDKFDLIILDPPWWNKYIRRKRSMNSDDGYKMMWNTELAEIPIDILLEQDGLLAIWCTNSKSHIDAIKTQWFPKWGLDFVAQWFWLKVTKKGEAVTPYSPENGKQPFERILFGCRNQRNLPLPSHQLIISVPSAIHSHKPPLSNVLEKFLPKNPKGLEIFARYLLPDFTSYGNQVLKLQHISLFSKTIN